MHGDDRCQEEKSFKKPYAPMENVEALTEKYKDKLPSEMLLLWSENGWCSYMDGKPWTVDPDAYRRTVNFWLGDGVEFDPEDYIPIFRTAYGNYILHEKNRYGNIIMYFLRVSVKLRLSFIKAIWTNFLKHTWTAMTGNSKAWSWIFFGILGIQKPFRLVWNAFLLSKPRRKLYAAIGNKKNPICRP
jgi:hypothetical protein